MRSRPDSLGCSLHVPNWSIFASAEWGFSPYRYGTFWHKYFPSTEDITFFPEIFYHGMKIYPESWDREREEPIIRCLATPHNMDAFRSSYLQDVATRVNARYPCDVLLADGWERTGRVEYIKFLHVDDIEKVEGPPPEGAF